MSRFRRRVESLERASETSLNAGELDLQAYRDGLAFEFDTALAKLIRSDCPHEEFWGWLSDSAERGGVPVSLADLDPMRFPTLVALYARVTADFAPRWK